MKRFFRDYFKGFRQPAGIRELLVLAFPMIISTACDGVMTFTDRLFLARLGPEHMNAAMGGGVTFQVLIFFFVGVLGYSTALVAQYFGAGRKKETTVAAFQAVLVVFLSWPVILLLKPLAIGYFYMMGLPDVQLELQIKYLNILAWGALFGLLRYSLGCYFSGIGKTKIVMVATLVAMLVNVVLDYLLIFGRMGFPEMGIEGAALATVLGSVSGVVILVVAYLGRENRLHFGVLESFRFRFVVMKQLLFFGFPAGLEMFLNFLAFSAMIMLFHAQGEVVATATTIMFNWDLVSFIPLLGIEVAVTSLVGRYMGARQPDLARRAAISAIKTGIFYSLIILALFLFIPEWLVRVFHPADQSPSFEEAVPIAVSMIRIAALYVLAEAVLVAIVGALRGAGDTFFTMIASVSAHWLFVPLLYVSLNWLHWPVTISWLLLVIFFLVFCLILVWRFQSGKWKNIRVIQEG